MTYTYKYPRPAVTYLDANRVPMCTSKKSRLFTHRNVVMKKTLTDVHNFFLNTMPYMVLLVVVLLLIDIAKLSDMQNDIDAIQQNVDYMHNDISDLLEKSKNSHFDNSDIISVIRAHHKKISSQIDEAERQIKANTVIWSK